MTQVYYKTYKVPMWIILDKMDEKKTEMLAKWLSEAGARNQVWPAKDFYGTLMAFKKKGWGFAFENTPAVLSPQLVMLATKDHVKRVIDPLSEMAIPYNVSTVNRGITDEASAEDLFNRLMMLQTPIQLSQMFRVADVCHEEDKRTVYKTWFTQAPANVDLIRQISDRVVSIGDSSNFDIDLSDKNDIKKVSGILTKYFSNK